jgi:hypothetical protein
MPIRQGDHLERKTLRRFEHTVPADAIDRKADLLELMRKRRVIGRTRRPLLELLFRAA